MSYSRMKTHWKLEYPPFALHNFKVLSYLFFTSTGSLATYKICDVIATHWLYMARCWYRYSLCKTLHIAIVTIWGKLVTVLILYRSLLTIPTIHTLSANAPILYLLKIWFFGVLARNELIFFFFDIFWSWMMDATISV